MAVISIPELQTAPAPVEGQTEVRIIGLEQLQSAAARDERYGMLGLVLGVLVIALGALLILAGVASGESVVRIPLPGSDDPWEVTSEIPGVVFAFIGLAIVWLTRPTVKN